VLLAPVKNGKNQVFTDSRGNFAFEKAPTGEFALHLLLPVDQLVALGVDPAIAAEMRTMFTYKVTLNAYKTPLKLEVPAVSNGLILDCVTDEEDLTIESVSVSGSIGPRWNLSTMNNDVRKTPGSGTFEFVALPASDLDATIKVRDPQNSPKPMIVNGTLVGSYMITTASCRFPMDSTPGAISHVTIVVSRVVRGGIGYRADPMTTVPR
jgi:hypothetical protein